MKYIGIGISNIAFCSMIGFGIYITKNPNCLWALFFVMWINIVFVSEN